MKYLLLLFVWAMLQAGGLESYRPSENCQNIDMLDNHSRLRCHDEEFRFYDRQLNQVYRELMRRLPAEERGRLKAAERAWIKFRDLECDFEAFPMRGGSGEALFVGACLVEQTKNRLHQLSISLDNSGPSN